VIASNSASNMAITFGG